MLIDFAISINGKCIVKARAFAIVVTLLLMHHATASEMKIVELGKSGLTEMLSLWRVEEVKPKKWSIKLQKLTLENCQVYQHRHSAIKYMKSYHAELIKREYGVVRLSNRNDIHFIAFCNSQIVSNAAKSDRIYLALIIISFGDETCLTIAPELLLSKQDLDYLRDIEGLKCVESFKNGLKDTTTELTQDDGAIKEELKGGLKGTDTSK